MSRIGYKEIIIPEGVTIDIKDGGIYFHKEIEVSGPKGKLTESIKKGIAFKIEDKILHVTRENEEKEMKSLHGLYRSLIQNMVTGVTEGYKKDLEIVGIGYRVEQKGEGVSISVGYSHKINYVPPVGITLQAVDQTNIAILGVNKQLVGEVAAKIRAFRKPEPYKGKGIRYKGEAVRKKSSKSAGV